MTTANGPSTSTDIALTDRQQRMIALRDDMEPGARPGAIVPRNFAEAQAMCSALAYANLVPKAFRERPADMLVVVLAGMEVGIPPMAALRLYTTWDGVPRLMAEGIRAVILSSPDCEYFEPQTMSESSVTWIGKKRGRPEKSLTWTVERARKAGLLDKDLWKKYPEELMNARCSTGLGRILWPHLVAGMVSLEEARDGDFIDADFKEQPFAAPPVSSFTLPTPAARVVLTDAQARGVLEHNAASATPVATDPPRRGPGRPPKVVGSPEWDAKAHPAPTSSPTSTVSAASSSPSPANSTSTSSAPASSASSVAAPATSSPSKLEAAVAVVEAKRPTENGSSAPPATESSPSTLSPVSTPESTANGASTAEDDFGAEQTSAVTLAEYHGWLKTCKTQRDLQAGKGEWRLWSQLQAKPVKEGGGGNPDFYKDGKLTIEMQDAFARRRTELPA